MPMGSYSYEIGDRVMTYNAQRGTVVDVVWDEDEGNFLLVKLDNMYGEYAYDVTEVSRLNSMPSNKIWKKEVVLGSKPKRTTA